MSETLTQRENSFADITENLDATNARLKAHRATEGGSRMHARVDGTIADHSTEEYSIQACTTFPGWLTTGVVGSPKVLPYKEPSVSSLPQSSTLTMDLQDLLEVQSLKVGLYKTRASQAGACN
eukprot:6457551-Amphidinium_carterae.1